MARHNGYHCDIFSNFYVFSAVIVRYFFKNKKQQQLEFFGHTFLNENFCFSSLKFFANVFFSYLCIPFLEKWKICISLKYNLFQNAHFISSNCTPDSYRE